MDQDLLAGTCEDRIVDVVLGSDDGMRKRRAIRDNNGSWAYIGLAMLDFMCGEKLGATWDIMALDTAEHAISSQHKSAFLVCAFE